MYCVYNIFSYTQVHLLVSATISNCSTYDYESFKKFVLYILSCLLNVAYCE
jgi:hypothetical protein